MAFMASPQEPVLWILGWQGGRSRFGKCDDGWVARGALSVDCHTPIRVRYAETDAMGIVHHAVYPVWMELGRSEWMRQMGQSYAEWETQGVRMSVSEIQITYRSPARYDELVEVVTRVQEAGRRKVVFAYEILRNGALLAEGRTVHLVTGEDGRSRVLPDHLRAWISQSMAPQS